MSPILFYYISCISVVHLRALLQSRIKEIDSYGVVLHAKDWNMSHTLVAEGLIH
jgi:hypothetical protein